MRKIKILFIIALLVITLAACGQKSAIQSATGASAQQNRTIEDALDSAGITYEMINEANHNRPDTDIPEGYKVYNLIDKDGKNYFMVLNNNFEVVVLMDSDENIIWGEL